MKLNFGALGGIGFLLSLAFVACKPGAAVPSNSTETWATIHAVGYLEPRSKLRRLAFQSHGMIMEVNVDVGDHVKAGDIIAKLDDRIEQTALGVANAKLALVEANRTLVLAGAHPDAISIAESAFLTASEEMNYRDREKQRMLAISDRRGVSAFERDAAIYQSCKSETRCAEAGAALELLKNQVREEDRAMLDAQVSLAKAEVAQAQELLNQKVLKVTLDGVIAERFLEVGQAISAAESTPIFLLAPAGPIDARVEVDERFSSRVKVGWKAQVRLPYSAQIYDGRIRLIKPVMGRKSVFSRDATERMDLQVLEVWVEVAKISDVPIGSEVQVEIIPDANEYPEG
jgi:multidrug efflux pump subunit AcrA (membrane-fusion protein)